MNRKTLFLLTAGLLVLAFAGATVLFQNNGISLPGGFGNKDQGVLEREGAPVKGAVEARVTIVEFFDPACGTCAEFYPFVQQLLEQYPGKVRVMMRYAPLHRGSDQVVTMLEAAHRQGKFWQALELLFSNQRRWVVNHVSQPTRARALLNSLAMDHEKLNADIGLPDVIQAVQQDVGDLQTLKVQATPEFFVNGRPLPSFGFAQLRQLVEEAVADAY